jgi:hypothetical protein
MPDQPPTALEEARCRELEIGQDLGESTDIECSRWLKNPGSLFYPFERPVDVLLLRFKGIPFRFLDVIWRVCKNEINGFAAQRTEPDNRVSNPDFPVGMRVEENWNFWI